MKRKSKKLSGLITALLMCGTATLIQAQNGPFDPEEWPTTIDPNMPVHFVVTDGMLGSPGGAWIEEALIIRNDGDQTTTDITLNGHTGKKATSDYLNVADIYFSEWASYDTIDILVQVYGDASLFNNQGQPRTYNFLTGTLPDVHNVAGGQIAAEANNKRWNWVLFRIPNDIRPSDGQHYIGTIPGDAQGAYNYGGVNNGTIRFQNVPGLTVRVVAFGPQGAFGEPEQINQFLPPDTCDPEPETNLVGLDIANNTANHLEVIDRGDQTVEYQDGVGPTGDQRRAVRPQGTFLNFGITDNYLGLPCNDPHTVKVCVEFYDDPSFAGYDVRFGPDAYATDASGGVAFFPAEQRQLLEGTGEWIRRSWTIPSVNLYGVNAAPTHTAGPRFVSENGQVFVSSVQLAVLRTGDHPLAGQDPLADCYEDPNICTERYGNYAELDLAQGISDGLALGTSGGDQEMIEAEVGPATDRRLAVYPARDEGTPGFRHEFLNFKITDEIFGPSSQPNAHLAICITYYDDPALVGARIRPEVYRTMKNGILAFGYTPESYYVTLQGSDTWKQAYWEINDMNFTGVNESPQAAARFIVQDANGIPAKIAVTQVRYGVIRPCGPLAGVNPLEDCKPVEVTLNIQREGNEIVLSWPASVTGFVVQSTDDLSAPQWSDVNATVQVVGELQLVRLPLSGNTQFFRLAR
ncbi:MAG TPA: hypothetical protein PLT00_10385 [Verrucomicrobiota bacterium]|nr:MAG: hypothetical protein BWX84_00137 [Verrucomicrobia bacterium ADurb.Bin118]HPY30644.1 hypothetical protein [Verrucomicrobiota bacterium]HQB17104.1 hypothetical protein [Verrucomicrobiota bacterium]